MYAAAAPYSSPDPLKVKAAVADWLQSMTPPEDSSTARFAVTLTLNVEAMHRNARNGVLAHSTDRGHSFQADRGQRSG
jgi:hypothetical protein